MSNPQKFVEARLKVAEGIMMEIVGDMKVCETPRHSSDMRMHDLYCMARQFTRRRNGHMHMILSQRRLEHAERILNKFVRGMEKLARSAPLGRPLAMDYCLACRFLGKWPSG